MCDWWLLAFSLVCLIQSLNLGYFLVQLVAFEAVREHIFVFNICLQSAFSLDFVILFFGINTHCRSSFIIKTSNEKRKQNTNNTHNQIEKLKSMFVFGIFDVFRGIGRENTQPYFSRTFCIAQDLS